MNAMAYQIYRDRMAGDIRRRLIEPSIDGINAASMKRAGLGVAEAAEWTERFLQDLQRGRDDKQRRAGKSTPSSPARR